MKTSTLVLSCWFAAVLFCQGMAESHAALIVFEGIAGITASNGQNLRIQDSNDNTSGRADRFYFRLEIEDSGPVTDDFGREDVNATGGKTAFGNFTGQTVTRFQLAADPFNIGSWRPNEGLFEYDSQVIQTRDVTRGPLLPGFPIPQNSEEFLLAFAPDPATFPDAALPDAQFGPQYISGLTINLRNIGDENYLDDLGTGQTLDELFLGDLESLENFDDTIVDPDPSTTEPQFRMTFSDLIDGTGIGFVVLGELDSFSADSGNMAPIAADNAIPAFENQDIMFPGSLLANDIDPDFDALMARLITPPSHGDVIVNPDGSLHYTPVPNFSGLDFFTYVANDGLLDSNVATVKVVVFPAQAPEPPSAAILGFGLIALTARRLSRRKKARRAH